MVPGSSGSSTLASRGLGFDSGGAGKAASTSQQLAQMVTASVALSLAKAALVAAGAWCRVWLRFCGGVGDWGGGQPLCVVWVRFCIRRWWSRAWWHCGVGAVQWCLGGGGRRRWDGACGAAAVTGQRRDSWGRRGGLVAGQGDQGVLSLLSLLMVGGVGVGVSWWEGEVVWRVLSLLINGGGVGAGS